jgi:hypothetical protein
MRGCLAQSRGLGTQQNGCSDEAGLAATMAIVWVIRSSYISTRATAVCVCLCTQAGWMVMELVYNDVCGKQAK